MQETHDEGRSLNELRKQDQYNTPPCLKIIKYALNLRVKIVLLKFIAYKNEPVHEISNNVLRATRKASDQPAHTRSLIRAFASRLSIL